MIPTQALIDDFYRERVLRARRTPISKEHEQFVHNAVLTGRYASQDDVIRDALSRLKQDMSKGTEMASQNAEAATKSSEEKSLVEALNDRLLAAGLVTQLPDPAQALRAWA